MEQDVSENKDKSTRGHSTEDEEEPDSNREPTMTKYMMRKRIRELEDSILNTDTHVPIPNGHSTPYHVKKKSRDT